jgi:hypothetical protein
MTGPDWELARGCEGIGGGERQNLGPADFRPQL